MKWIVALVLLLIPSTAFASPPDVPKELKAPAGKVTEFTVKPDGTKKFGKTLVGGNAAFRGFPGDKPGEMVYWLIPENDGPLWIVWVTEGETEQVVTIVNKGAVVPVTPKVDPTKPDNTPPAVVTSFRVIFVFESMQALDTAQKGVIYGKAVEDYLNSTCTGGKTGWRRRDKDLTGESDPTMAAMWNSIKPANLPNGQPDPNRVTVTPCVAIEINSKVTLEPLPSSPADMIALFKKYNGGK